MPVLRIDGYVIVSADGMLANAAHVMPDELRFEGDKQFFTAALDRADLIVHGRHSYEDQPNSPRRTRIIVTRSIAAVTPDPSNPRPRCGIPREPRSKRLRSCRCPFRTAAVIGGGCVRNVHGPLRHVLALAGAAGAAAGGEPCFPGVPERSPQAILAAHGLKAGEAQILDAAGGVSVTPWRRAV